MTREAIEYFKFHRKIFCDDHLKICPKNSVAYQATLKEKGFYDMAIKALEQEPCPNAISRSDMLDAIGHGMTYTSEELQKIIKGLPPVNPQTKIGHWITKPHIYGVAFCSECDFELRIDDTKYCPNCGAKMVEPQEREGTDADSD